MRTIFFSFLALLSPIVSFAADLSDISGAWNLTYLSEGVHHTETFVLVKTDLKARPFTDKSIGRTYYQVQGSKILGTTVYGVYVETGPNNDLEPSLVALGPVQETPLATSLSCVFAFRIFNYDESRLSFGIESSCDRRLAITLEDLMTMRRVRGGVLTP